MEFHPKGYCGVCKQGRPIFIERVGKMKPAKISEIIDDDTFFRSFYQEYETVIKLNFMVCSYLKGQQI